MAGLKTVVFDFDGVLVESVGIKDQAFEEIFSQYPDHYEEIMQYHLAHNATIRYEKFKHIWTDILGRDYSAEVEEELCGRYERRIVDKIVQCPQVAGATDILSFLSAKMPLYIVSMNPLDELRAILDKRGLLAFFKDVYAFPWKKKDALADILKLEGLTEQQAVFIGDTPEDCLAARENGVTFIGRQSNKKLPEDVFVFQNLTDIQKFLADQYNIHE